MEQEHENESTKTGFNTNAISIVLSAVAIFSSYGGVFLKSPALKSLSYVVVFILLIVVSYPSLFCKTKTQLKKLNKVINTVCFSIAILAALFSLSGGTLLESCARPSSTPIITPTPVPEILDPSGKIAAGNDFSMLLRSDMKVVTYGRATGIDTSNWENIIQISAYKDHAIGLREDRTVVVTGKDFEQYDVSGWSGIRQVVACKDAALGVTMDGRIVFAGPNKSCIPACQSWKGIKRIIGAACIIVAERNDGSLIATDEYIVTDPYMANLAKRIVSGTAVDNRMLFVLEGGRVKATGESGVLENLVATWTDMLQVAVGNGFAIGLRENDTVVSIGAPTNEELRVSGWNNVAAICVGGSHILGLCKDGTVLTDGSEAGGLANIANENYWVSN